MGFSSSHQNSSTTLPFFLALLACFACGQGNPGPTQDGDWAAIEEQMKQRGRELAEAYRQEHAGDLPATAQEVIDRYLEVVGGIEAFDTIRTMIRRTTHHGTSGKIGDQVRYYRKPLYYRWEQSDAPVALVTDGQRFWWVGPEGWDEIRDGTSYLPSASMDSHFINPQAVGVTYELVGVAAFDGAPGFEVRRIWPHGREDLLFFAAESGLLTLMRYPHPLGGEYWSSYWDYRDLGGVVLPYANVTNIDFTPPHGSILEEVEINVPLPDSLFMPPEELGLALSGG